MNKQEIQSQFGMEYRMPPSCAAIIDHLGVHLLPGSGIPDKETHAKWQKQHEECLKDYQEANMRQLEFEISMLRYKKKPVIEGYVYSAGFVLILLIVMLAIRLL